MNILKLLASALIAVHKAGLVHGDLGMDSNLLFYHGNAHAIDFDEIIGPEMYPFRKFDFVKKCCIG